MTPLNGFVTICSHLRLRLSDPPSRRRRQPESSERDECVQWQRFYGCRMNVVWAALIVGAATAAAVAALLLVRRHAPERGFFQDGDRAAGVFGVLATGFSVLLGFIVFLAFTSYDQSRSGAEQEALVVV